MVPVEASEVPFRKLSDAELADQFSETRLAWKAWQPAVNPHHERFLALSGELIRRQDNQPRGRIILVHGEKWTVPISACEQQSKITDKPAVYRAIRRLGADVLLEAYTVTLAKARKFLTAKQQEKWIETERTGPREIREPVLKEAR